MSDRVRPAGIVALTAHYKLTKTMDSVVPGSGNPGCDPLLEGDFKAAFSEERAKRAIGFLVTAGITCREEFRHIASNVEGVFDSIDSLFRMSSVALGRDLELELSIDIATI